MEIHKVIQDTESRMYGSDRDYKHYAKGRLLEAIGNMDQDEVNEFCKEILKLQHHKDTTEGLYAIDKDPSNLLEDFWQRTSDACPLEATQAEKETDEFHDWSMDKFFQIEY